MKWLTALRRITQLAVIALFCCLPWLNSAGFNQVSGSLFAFDIFGIPFADPASALQALAASPALPIRWRILVGALLALLLAFCLGRIFCGWLCPYGLASELIHSFRKSFAPAPPRKLPSALFAFWLKLILLTIALLAMFFFAFPLVTLLSFPGELSLFPLELRLNQLKTGLLLVYIVPLAAAFAELFFGQRLWCRFFCPQSVLLGIAAWLPKRFPVLRISWTANKCACGKNSPCRQACSLNLNPRQKTGPTRRDCIMCGECVKTCRNYGKALAWNVKSDFAFKNEGIKFLMF